MRSLQDIVQALKSKPDAKITRQFRALQEIDRIFKPVRSEPVNAHKPPGSVQFQIEAPDLLRHDNDIQIPMPRNSTRSASLPRVGTGAVLRKSKYDFMSIVKGPAYCTRSKKGVDQLANQLVDKTRRAGFDSKTINHQRLVACKLCEQANGVLDEESGEVLEYRNLRKHPRYSEDWSISSANEFGRLAQGVGGRIKGTDTIKFISKDNIPEERFKDVTYGKFVCEVKQNKAETNRTRLTVGGNRINYPFDVGTPTADLVLVKILLNSVISTPGAKFMTADVKNFYLNTPLK